MSNSAFTPTVLTIPATAGSGSGQGEVNVVTNPAAATDVTGWTAGTITPTRDASGSPLDPVVPTGLNINASAGSQTLLSSAFNVPETLRNKKLKVEFYYKYVSGSSFTLDILDGGSTSYSLSTDVAGVTTLPQSSGKFTCYIDTNNTSSLSFRLTSTGAGVMKMTQVIIGPGIQPQGAVVGEWISYTPTSGLTNATHTGKYRRVGSNIELRIDIAFSGAPAGSFSFTQAQYLNGLNLTVDSTALPNTTDTVINAGSWGVLDSGANDRYGGAVNLAPGATNALAPVSSAGVPVSPTAPITFGAGDNYSLYLTLPIAEWAGSGTVQLAQNDVEYVSNTSSWDSNTNSTTAFAYGPSGQLIPASTDLTDLRKKRVRFQSPIQPGDQILVELQINGTWVPAIGSAGAGDWNLDGFSYTTSSASTATKGIGWQPVPGTSTDIDVYFGRYATFYNNVTTIGWTSFVSSNVVRWRVRKSSAGAAVGFGLYQPGVSAGLVSSSGLAGRADGNVVPSGYVGELLFANPGSAVAPGASVQDMNKTVVSITLSPGIWAVSGVLALVVGSSTGLVFAYAGISTSNNAADSSTKNNVAGVDIASASTSKRYISTPTRILNVSTSTPVYLVGGIQYTTLGTAIYDIQSSIQAVRIA